MIQNLKKCWNELNGKEYQEEPRTDSKYSLGWILCAASFAASATLLIVWWLI